MTVLSSLPNIGKALEKQLVLAGIPDVESLQKMEPQEVFLRLKPWTVEHASVPCMPLKGQNEGYGGMIYPKRSGRN